MMSIAADGVDYIGGSIPVTYFPLITEAIICVTYPIIDDVALESFELFGVTLTSTDPAVTFLIDSGAVLIADNDG